jgi:mannose/fructose-specific phosphotransferase system component IIA
LIKGLIVGHKDIGEAMLRAVKSITDDDRELFNISINELSSKEVTKKIIDFIDSAGNDGTIIFVDIYGGSCWRAAKHAGSSKCSIVTGFNLPMLLSFINKRNSVGFEELPAILENDGKRGITAE